MRLLLAAAASLLLVAIGIAWHAFFSGDEPGLQGQPEPPDNLAFVGGFETGDSSQWTWGAQCANAGTPSTDSIVRGTIAVQSEVVAEGKYAARFDLPASEVNNACETLSKRTPGVGSDDYYGLLVRFPSAWREPSPARWGLMIAQLNFQNIWGPPVGLAAHGDHVALVLSSGLCKPVGASNPGCAYSSGLDGNVPPMAAIPAPLALDSWHALIVHVRWATDTSGRIEIWHRPEGATRWRKTVSLRGYPTLQWTAQRGPTAVATGNTSDKIGAYRGAADFPLTVWLDGFVRTRSLVAAKSALP